MCSFILRWQVYDIVWYHLGVFLGCGRTWGLAPTCKICLSLRYRFPSCYEELFWIIEFLHCSYCMQQANWNLWKSRRMTRIVRIQIWVKTGTPWYSKMAGNWVFVSPKDLPHASALTYPHLRPSSSKNRGWTYRTLLQRWPTHYSNPSAALWHAAGSQTGLQHCDMPLPEPMWYIPQNPERSWKYPYTLGTSHLSERCVLVRNVTNHWTHIWHKDTFSKTG